MFVYILHNSKLDFNCFLFSINSQNDDPKKTRRHDRYGDNKFKVSRNMLRRMEKEANNRNTMDSRLYGDFQCRPHSNKGNAKKSENQTRQTHRHEPKRRRRLERKCKDGNDSACRKLCQRSNRRNSNSDLTKSLGKKSRRSSKNHQDGGKNKRLSRKQLRKERRRAKRQRRKEQRRLRRQRKKNLKKQRKTRSTMSPSTCRTKYIDTCSWPTCNRSCPKLKNPKTGKRNLIN